MKQKLILLTTIALMATTHTVWAHAHIHIGTNMDQADGTGDDNTLFMFGMPPASQPENYWPDFPRWGDASDPYNMTAEPLKLVYQDSGILAGKYLCEYINCFHSAHPDHGNWQLGGTDESTNPDWSIGIELTSASKDLKFLSEDTLLPVMRSDGDQVVFSPQWFSDKINETGTYGAWGIHEHLLFVIDGDGVEIGDTFYATINAFDETGMLSDSEAYTLRFEAVPEPATLVMMAIGSLALLRRK